MLRTRRAEVLMGGRACEGAGRSLSERRLFCLVCVSARLPPRTAGRCWPAAELDWFQGRDQESTQPRVLGIATRGGDEWVTQQWCPRH